MNHVIPCLLLLHPDFHVGLAVALLLVLAWKVVELVFRVARQWDNGVGMRHQIRAGSLEVVIGLGALSAAELVLVLPALQLVDDFRLRQVRLKLHVLVLQFDIGPRMIAQHERVFALLVLEVIEDPFLLHQAGDEVEIGLPILDAVLPRRMRSAQLEFEVVESQIPEYLLDHVRDRLVLKNAAIGGPGEEPEPRDDLSPVKTPSIGGPAKREPIDKAVEVARRTVRVTDIKTDALTDDSLRLEIVLFREHLQVEMKQSRHLLASSEGGQDENVLPQGRFEKDCSFVLDER